MSNTSGSSFRVLGLLIQTSLGTAGGFGAPRTNRSGLAANAFLRTRALSSVRFAAPDSEVELLPATYYTSEER